MEKDCTLAASAEFYQSFLGKETSAKTFFAKEIFAEALGYGGPSQPAKKGASAKKIWVKLFWDVPLR